LSRSTASVGGVPALATEPGRNGTDGNTCAGRCRSLTSPSVRLGDLRRGKHHMNLFVTRTWLQAKFAKDEKGASMVEYILLVALIALAVIAAVVFLKNQVNSKFNDAGSKLSSSGG